MLLRLALAAFMGLSACSDDGGGGAAPDAGGVTGPGTTAQLRQTASLSGSYASRIQLTGNGWEASQSSHELTLTFLLEGMTSVKQAEVWVRPEPAEAFDMATAAFAAASPFQTFGTGVQADTRDGFAELRMGGANLGSVKDGDGALGTLTIRTSSSFNQFTDARLVVTKLSLGPRSDMRDVYEADALNLGVSLGR